MRTVKFVRIMLLIVLLTGMAGLAVGQVRPDRQQMRQRMEKMHNDQAPHMRIPNLTDEQKEQIKSLMLKHREAMIPLQNQLREKMARLRTLSTGSEVDENAAESVIDEIGDLRTQVIKGRFRAHQEIRGLLTDEQRVWLDSHPRRFGHGRMSMHPYNR